jgi:CSLREA domain-containing protein
LKPLLLLASLSLLLFAWAAPGPVHAATLVVNSLGDEPDAAINGNCLTALNTCTLRAAIQEANVIGGPDTITFSVAGMAVLGSSLPPITDPLTIAGPGSSQLTIKRRPAGDNLYREC